MNCTKNMAGEIISILLISGFLLDAIWNQHWAGNIAAFGVWVLISSAAFLLFFEEPCKSSKNKYPHMRYMWILLLLVMVGCGWTITSTVGFVLWFCLYVKKKAYIEGLENENDKTI